MENFENKILLAEQQGSLREPPRNPVSVEHKYSGNLISLYQTTINTFSVFILFDLDAAELWHVHLWRMQFWPMQFLAHAILAHTSAYVACYNGA